jgi:hypothetical protein
VDDLTAGSMRVEVPGEQDPSRADVRAIPPKPAAAFKKLLRFITEPPF